MPSSLGHGNYSSANLMPAGMSSANSSSKDVTTSSLSVNYLPTKFGTASLRNRGVPRGGGTDAFGKNANRMAGSDDYDSVSWPGAGKDKKRRWNRFKWTIFFLNLMVTIYGIGALIVCLLTWFNTWEEADIIRVGNRAELIMSTVAAGSIILTSLVGWAGILLNNRPFIAVYNLLLWVSFALLLVPGYYTCRRRLFNIEGKVNKQWSQDLGVDGRLRVQNLLKCCGYFSPFSGASVSQTCYARTTLPGCKGPYLRFQLDMLKKWYLCVFAIVPFHIAAIVGGLTCGNHVTYRFGKGMMPKAYRLNQAAMAQLIDNMASQLTEQYGAGVGDRPRGGGGGGGGQPPFGRSGGSSQGHGYPASGQSHGGYSSAPQPKRQQSDPRGGYGDQGGYGGQDGYDQGGYPQGSGGGYGGGRGGYEQQQDYGYGNGQGSGYDSPGYAGQGGYSSQQGYGQGSYHPVSDQYATGGGGYGGGGSGGARF